MRDLVLSFALAHLCRLRTAWSGRGQMHVQLQAGLTLLDLPVHIWQPLQAGAACAGGKDPPQLIHVAGLIGPCDLRTGDLTQRLRVREVKDEQTKKEF